MFPYFRVSGTPRQIGEEVGEKAKKQIHHNIKAYGKLFSRLAKITWETAQKEAKKYVSLIEQYDKDILEEMHGISKGAGVDFLDIVALNTRSEIILNADGCTSLAATPPATMDNSKTFLAQNWDWGSFISEGTIMLEIQQHDSKPKILMVTEAGIVGKIGMNNYGLGVCLNLLGTSDRKLGVPIHVVLRGILNSKTISQSVGQATRMDRGTSANFLVAHKEGEALNLEMAPHDYDVIYPTENKIAHANHFIGPRSVNYLDTARINYPDTHLRQGRMDYLMNEKVTIGLEDVKEMLKDHSGYPDAICRHGEEYPIDLGRDEKVNTVLSVIMDLKDGIFHITDGLPCKNPYEKFDFHTDMYDKEYFND